VAELFFVSKSLTFWENCKVEEFSVSMWRFVERFDGEKKREFLLILICHAVARHNDTYPRIQWLWTCCKSPNLQTKTPINSCDVLNSFALLRRKQKESGFKSNKSRPSKLSPLSTYQLLPSPTGQRRWDLSTLPILRLFYKLSSNSRLTFFPPFAKVFCSKIRLFSRDFHPKLDSFSYERILVPFKFQLQQLPTERSHFSYVQQKRDNRLMPTVDLTPIRERQR
jgi:hypothetical protein